MYKRREKKKAAATVTTTITTTTASNFYSCSWHEHVALMEKANEQF